MKSANRSWVMGAALALGACAGSGDSGENESASTPTAGDSSATATTAATTPSTGTPGAGGAPPDVGPPVTSGANTSEGAQGGGGAGPDVTSPSASAGAPGEDPLPNGGTSGTGSGGEATSGAGGVVGTPQGGAAGSGENSGTAGAAVGGSGTAGAGGSGAVDQGGERIDGVSENFSFFVTSYFHIKELSGSDDGFGGDLSYNGKVGIEGADAICQEMASRVGFNNRTWRAYLSTSTVDAKDRIGTGPWYDFAGNLVAEDVEGLLVEKTEQEGGGGPPMGGGGGMMSVCAGEDSDTDRPLGGALDCGTYDELGLFHDGSTDQDNDGTNDDDHDTMTATLADGTYAGFSCDDWTSTTATVEGGGEEGGGFGSRGGIMMGHSWGAFSGMHWSEAHDGHACAAGTNFIQDGPGDAATVGGGGGYGGFYCFALSE